MTLFEKLPEQAPAQMTKSAFAREIGVSPGRITQMIGDGMPVLPTGRVSVKEAKSWYAANIRKPLEIASGNAHELTSLRIAREQAQLQALQVENRRKEGSLVDRKIVETAIFERARAERDAHMAWVSRVAPTIAAELGVDLTNLYAALDREMRQHLQELSETPLDDLSFDA